jgi:hypothetical protein
LWEISQQANIVAGSTMWADGTSQVVTYVGKRVASPAARLDHFLMHQGVKTDERVTVISDGAGVDFSILCRLFQQECRKLECGEQIERGISATNAVFRRLLGLQAQQSFHRVQRKGFEQ